jgi:Carboxypeptidase regulatory-like domain/TonB dependent receptor
MWSTAYDLSARLRWRPLVAFAALSAFASAAYAQSIATLKGRVTDASGAIVTGATITVRAEQTGVQRSAISVATGEYQFTFLPVGAYRVEIQSPGFRPEVVPRLVVEVGRTIVRDFHLEVGDVAETVTIASEVPLIEHSIALGQIIDERTMESIPLNGRKVLQLALLAPGSMTPPQAGALTTPSRAQGSQAINSAGHREGTANFQVNGITLNDQLNNILIFQPPIDSVEEFRIDNASPQADYGRNSGASINIVTRSGTNQLHGGLVEFFRHRALDARNAFSTGGEAPFQRHQFGGHVGGPVARNRTFFFATYEGLRQDQGLPVNSVVLSDAQRMAISHPVIRKLIGQIPRATQIDERGIARFIGWADAPVDVHQWAGDFSHQFGRSQRLHGFYALQSDRRSEPLELGSTLPGFGDLRLGRRQLLTVEHTVAADTYRLHQTRAGFSRLAFESRPLAQLSAADYGVETGQAPGPGLPVFNVAGAFTFGGPAVVTPSWRTDTTTVISHAMSYARGAHAIRSGGEFRQFTYNARQLDAGTFNFPSVPAFMSGVANSFRVALGDQPAYITQRALGVFGQDSVRVHSKLTVDLGVRYEWNITPTERDDRWVVFDANTASLLRIGVHRDEVYRQNHNLEPRIGVAWDPWAGGRTLVRAAYALTVEQPIINAVSNLGGNPPLGVPLTVTGVVPVESAFRLAGAAGLAPVTINPNYENGAVHSWNVNLQREIGSRMAALVGYVWSQGTQLRLSRNINQPVNGVRPYPFVSDQSPILPGAPLGNITQVESSGKSSYRALWVSLTQRLSRGLQFSGSYTWSRSLDYNSLSGPATSVTVQNSYDVADSRGLSDFDARHRLVVSAVYELPFGTHTLLEGWRLAAILQAQSGNPVSIVTSNSTLTGVANTVRPDVTGPVEIIGDVNRWFDPSVFVAVDGFGNLQRNSVVGPSFANLDVSIAKTIRASSRVRVLVQADVFNVLNHASLGQPGRIVGSPNFGVITNTRFPPGDSGSSRQTQLGVKIVF